MLTKKSESQKVKYDTKNQKNRRYDAIGKNNEIPMYRGTKKQYNDLDNENFSYVFLRNKNEIIFDESEIEMNKEYKCQFKMKKRVDNIPRIKTNRTLVSVKTGRKILVRVERVRRLYRRTNTTEIVLFVLEKIL